MPRRMPLFATTLDQRVQEALKLAEAGELALVTSPRPSLLRSAWNAHRVELLYELAYLRMFIEWEAFLERTFVRYLCGYTSRHGVASPIGGRFKNNLATAEAAVLGGRPFALWHRPSDVIARAQAFFIHSLHETVVASNEPRLVDLAAVRHRIAHGQEDAKRKFDRATMNFTGRRYSGARPGRFLRDWNHSISPTNRWLQSLGGEMVNLAKQIA